MLDRNKMMRVFIVRERTGIDGTFGRLISDGFTCYTGELPWRDNLPGLSCIPSGTYRCVWSESPRLKRKTYRVLGVPGRSGILFHSANFVGDKSAGKKAQVQGCIALGERIGLMDGQASILVSQPAVRRFEAFMAGRPFNLEVLDV